MSTQKSVAFFVRSINDQCVKINGISYNVPAYQMPNVDSNYWQQADPDGIQDLCTQIDSTTTSVTGTFIDEQNNTYELQSQDFVGGRPPHRPH